MKQSFNAKEFTAILILELKIWSDKQLELVECLSNRVTVVDNCGLTTSFDCLTSNEQFFADFSSENEYDEREEYGAEAHTEEFLATQDEVAKKEAHIKSMVILATEKETITGLDAEVVELYAAQKVCLEDAPNAFSNAEPEEMITLTLKRFTKNGFWRTVTKDQDEYAPQFQISMHVNDIFDVNGNSVTLKRYGNKTALDMIIEKYYLDETHCYRYVEKETGELVFKEQRQALQAKGNFFKAGMVVEGVRLEATVAPSFHAVDDESLEVYPCLTYHGWDNITDVHGFLLIVPSAVDESNGDAAEQLFNEGIMYGTSEATQAMMSDDLTDAAILEMKKEEARTKREAKRVRRKMLSNRDIKASKDGMLLNSALGLTVVMMSELSFKAVNSRKAEIEVYDLLAKHSDKLEEIEKIAKAYQRVNNGKKCLESKVYKTLQDMIKGQKNKKFAGQVESHILENITNINNGSLDIADIDDETLVEIVEAARTFGKKTATNPVPNKACWITKDYAVLSDRYSKLMGIAGVATSKPKSSAVRKIDVA